jgi:hypothetical protein
MVNTVSKAVGEAGDNTHACLSTTALQASFLLVYNWAKKVLINLRFARIMFGYMLKENAPSYFCRNQETTQNLSWIRP